MGENGEKKPPRSNTFLPPRPYHINPSQTFHHIRSEILRQPTSTELILNDITAEVGTQVHDELVEDPAIEASSVRLGFDSFQRTFYASVMPGLIHNCSQYWLTEELEAMLLAGWITPAEKLLLHASSCHQTFDNFSGQYVGSRKVPDWFLLPAAGSMPSIVLETGYTDEWTRLMNEMRLWLLGSTEVQLVLLIKFTKHSNGRVSGQLRAYARDALGAPAEMNRIDIFPIVQGQPTAIPITRGQLYGVHPVPAGRGRGDVWDFQISRLRYYADYYIQRQGFLLA